METDNHLRKNDVRLTRLGLPESKNIFGAPGAAFSQVHGVVGDGT